jgi:lipoprotein-releasing system permease protein
MIIFTAWRQIIHRRRQSLASVASVAIGVGLSIMMSSMQLGFEDDFTERIIAVTPHVQITSERIRPYPDLGQTRYELSQVIHVKTFDKTSVINGPAFLQAKLSAIPTIKVISQAYSGQGLVSYGNKDQSVVIRGIEPDRENEISDFSGRLTLGNAVLLSTTKNGVVLGTGVARRIGARPGDTVTLVSDEGARELYRVVDLYQSGITAYDNRTLFILLKNAQSFFGVTGPNEFGLKLFDANEAENVAASLRLLTGLDTKDWITENENIRAELKRRRMINSMIVATIFVVAAFGIANIMLMNVMNKKRDIAIMQAFGVNRRLLASIYVTQGSLLGLIGSATGVLAGALLIWILSVLPVSFNATITRDGFPMVWSVPIFGLPAAIGIVVSILASVYPARRATRFPPAEVIRNG